MVKNKNHVREVSYQKLLKISLELKNSRTKTTSRKKRKNANDNVQQVVAQK